jgi:hypothetical protein
MYKCSPWQAGRFLLCLLGVVLAVTRSSFAADLPTSGYAVLSTTLLERAQNEVTRIEALVEQGTLPKAQLEEARVRLADAQDEATLAQTLYGQTRLENMTPEQAQAMLEAAQRRVERQSKTLANRQMLVDNGVIARSELTVIQDELDSRRRVLDLAQNRVKLLEDLQQMAEREQRLERAAEASAAESRNLMIRYDGNGLFSLADLTTISSQFQKRFHHALPVSALGQTLVHQSMGLDHRNRVDIALNPDQSEGVWLRQLLERLHVPYLAFRNAMAGAATAPHIHIGIGSTRLKLALR